ncbi:MAG: 6-phosphogluconolactonase [Thermoplasmata archaeon]|nr:6-phosphogluconolactonase [Thermoplasmata archaeon]
MDGAVGREIRVFPDLGRAAEALAADLAEAIRLAVVARGHARIVIPGGTSPELLFRELSGRYRREVPWDRVELFWTDERAVPPESPESNYGLAARTLLPLPGLAAARVHRMRGEAEPLEAEARRYEEELLRALALSPSGDYLAPFDHVILGVGPDGHTASLFPGSPRLEERNRRVVVERHPGQPPRVPRLSLSLAALNGTRELSFLVGGREKASVLARILGAPTIEAPPPAGLVSGLERTRWYLDAPAAAGLPVSR